jgi:hypothetical protein
MHTRPTYRATLRRVRHPRLHRLARAVHGANVRVHRGQIAWRVRIPSWIILGGGAWLIDPWLLPVGILIAEVGWIVAVHITHALDRRGARASASRYEVSRRQRRRENGRRVEAQERRLQEREAFVRSQLAADESLVQPGSQRHAGIYLTDRRLLLVGGVAGEPFLIDEMAYADVRHWEWRELHDRRQELTLTTVDWATEISFGSLRDPARRPMREQFPPS